MSLIGLSHSASEYLVKETLMYDWFKENFDVVDSAGDLVVIKLITPPLFLKSIYTIRSTTQNIESTIYSSSTFKTRFSKI